MNKNNLIISVGRQLGSGGHDVAKLLAQRFGCTFYDREILNIAAKESGFCEKFFEQTDEQKGFMKSLPTTVSTTTTFPKRACSSFRATL